ncbi:fatty acid-binding protein, liver-like [Synchiropus splendidus]|uniref:fatty acid-binding protein, liver-like n=1 Tax=Synchiropus splendidus TaxID=270530 RepID=UPI00237E6C1E|nr:fatty acid-binding protein, liver-like [Synchiropus splendidus]
MVDQFVGKWKLVQSDNFDDYMKAIDVNFAIRQMALTLKPQVEFCVDGEVICMKTISTFKNTELRFKLDEEFDEVTADNRNTKTVVTLSDGKLQQTQRWNGKTSTLTREIRDGKLICTCTMGDVISVRTYVRA